MIVTEASAKARLARLGVAIPPGAEARSVEEASQAAERIGGPWVVKALIPAGGRSQGRFAGTRHREGGVRFANTLDEVRAQAKDMLGQTLVTSQTGARGQRVRALYIEQRCALEREHYLALSIDAEVGRLSFMAAAEGGAEIEKLAERNPEAITRFTTSINDNEVPLQAIAQALSLEGEQHASLETTLQGMKSLLIDNDAVLVELNPVGCVANQSALLALDALIVWDDNALFRQGHEEQLTAIDALSPLELRAQEIGVNHVPLNGNVGVFSSGAGLAMATVDALIDAGASPANFLDIAPSANSRDIHDALEIVLDQSGLKVVLVHVFGGGIMRCDAVADALLHLHRNAQVHVPVVARLSGTNALLARQRLKQSMPSVRLVDSLAEAARCAAELAV